MITDTRTDIPPVSWIRSKRRRCPPPFRDRTLREDAGRSAEADDGGRPYYRQPFLESSGCDHDLGREADRGAGTGEEGGYAHNRSAGHEIFAYAAGHFDERSLATSKQLGYTNVFWSLAYMDWDVKSQRGAQYAYDKVTAQLHPGAVILLHSISKDNTEALGRIIDEARNRGYEFKSLDQMQKKAP